MKTKHLEVTDLFKTAFLLCMGCNLIDVLIRDHGKKMATFLISGSGVIQLDQDYRTGMASVNPLQLKESISHIKDIMFKKMREHDEGRYRNDRKRKNRVHQKQY